MSEGQSTEDEDDSDVADSEMESDEHEGEGRSRGRRANRGKKVREDKKTKKSEQKGLTEAEKIRKELQELKELITKDQGSSFRQGGIPKQVPVSDYQNLPAIEAYAMGNRLAQPVNYGPESRTSYSRCYPGREGRNTQWGNRGNVERANVPQWGQPRQPPRPWQEPGGNRGGSDPSTNQQTNDFSPYMGENRMSYQRRDRSQLVCYQCGIVGHLRYECHLLPQSGQARDLPPASTANQYSQDEYRAQSGERDTGNEGGRQERPTWGTRVPANLELRVVRQSSAVNGMVVELIHPFIGHPNDSDTSENSTNGVSGNDDGRNEKGKQQKCEWEKELTSKESSTVAVGDRRFVSPEVMAGEKARL